MISWAMNRGSKIEPYKEGVPSLQKTDFPYYLDGI